MKIAPATLLVLMWLLATLYCNNSHSVLSHTLWECYAQTCFITIATFNRTSNRIACYVVNDSENHTYINNIFLKPSLQSPLIHKWKGIRLRSKKNISKTYNNNILYCCRMAYARSLEKSLDGVKNMEVTQTKKRTLSTASLTIVDKTKNRSTTQGKTLPLWFGFKAMNALNASNKLAKENHKSVSELVRMGMYEGEALECQDSNVSYPYVTQELWPSKNKLGKQNYHHTQIPSEIETLDGFAMNYHVALFFELDEMISPKDEAHISITKRMNEMRIPLGDDISDPIAIMCTHGGKQWSGHAKIHLKNV